MKSKMMAILAVAVMMVSCGAVLMSAQTDGAESSYRGAGTADDPINLGTVYIATGGTDEETVELRFNESAYTSYAWYDFTVGAGSDYSTTIYKNVDGTESTTSGAVSNITFTLTHKQTGESTDIPGVFALGVKSNASAGSYDVRMKLTVTVALKDPSAESEKIKLTDIYYKIQVNVTGTQTLTITSPDALTARTNGEVELIVTAPTPIDVSRYQWYAYGLPGGLNIYTKEAKLYIGGLPTDATEAGGAKVKVVARNNDNGSEMSTEITVTVNPADDLAYYLVDSSGKKLPGFGDTWIHEYTSSTEAVKLVVSSGVTVTKVTVMKVSENSLIRDEATPVSGVSNQWYIPADGVGVYTIEITGPAGTTVATLHVIPSTTGSGAGIIVSGGHE